MSRPASALRGSPERRYRVECSDPPDQSTTAGWVHRCKGIRLFDLSRGVCPLLALEERKKKDHSRVKAEERKTIVFGVSK